MGYFLFHIILQLILPNRGDQYDYVFTTNILIKTFYEITTQLCEKHISCLLLIKHSVVNGSRSGLIFRRGGVKRIYDQDPV